MAKREGDAALFFQDLSLMPFLFLFVLFFAPLPSRQSSSLSRSLINGPPPPAGQGQTRAEFAERRRRVRLAAKGAAVLLLLPPHDEEGEHVRPRINNNFLYLTGVAEPGACLVLLPENHPSRLHEILFVEQVSAAQSRYIGGRSDLGEISRQTGIASVRPLSELWTTLSPLLQSLSTAILLEAVPGESPFSPNGGLEAKLHALAPSLLLKGNAEALIAPLRAQKSPGELASLRRAIFATIRAEEAAARRIRPGVTELNIEGIILASFRENGCASEAFPSVVGSGPNSTVLHHYSDPRPMRAGETVVVDIGAEFHQYAADVTRTFPVSGKFNSRQRAVYRLVLETQRFCERTFVSGKTTLAQLDRAARTYLKASPLRWKDAQGRPHTMDTAFWHGLGHLVGLDVHDVGDRWDAPLLPGMVFTIEPGLYLPNENLGVRIEDDYFVTSGGLEKLSRGLPSRPEAIEAAMRRPTRKAKM